MIDNKPILLAFLEADPAILDIKRQIARCRKRLVYIIEGNLLWKGVAARVLAGKNCMVRHQPCRIDGGVSRGELRKHYRLHVYVGNHRRGWRGGRKLIVDGADIDGNLRPVRLARIGLVNLESLVGGHIGNGRLAQRHDGGRVAGLHFGMKG